MLSSIGSEEAVSTMLTHRLSHHLGDIAVKEKKERIAVKEKKEATWGFGSLPSTKNMEESAHEIYVSGLNATENVEEEIDDDVIKLLDAPVSEWTTLLCVVVCLMCVDHLVSSKLTSGSTKSHIAMLSGWVLCGAGFNVFYFWAHGASDGMDWLIGYFLEWMLSVDNLFVFQFIFRSYSTPAGDIQDKALFCGILGSIGTRAMLFCAIGSVMRSIKFIQCLFGILLIYAGVKSLHDDDDDEMDPSQTLLVRWLKKIMGTRLVDRYDLENCQLCVRDENGRLCATIMLPLIATIMVFDVIFAVDSVSAKVAQIPNQYTAYSSSVLALLGMRAMYFLIDDLVRYFELLRYGVCGILVFIGAQLMVAGKFQLPEWIVLLVIITVFNVCIVGSIFKKNFRNAEESGAEGVSVKADSKDAILKGDKLESAETCTKEGTPGKFDCKSKELREKLQTRLELSEGQSSPRAEPTPEIQPPRICADAADSAAGN
jgi:tellurite resistance protein TerC